MTGICIGRGRLRRHALFLILWAGKKNTYKKRCMIDVAAVIVVEVMSKGDFELNKCGK